jgi:hypothetical protein
MKLPRFFVHVPLEEDLGVSLFATLLGPFYLNLKGRIGGVLPWRASG